MMKLYILLACAALAAAAASGQNASPPKMPEPTDIQGIPTSPLPSALPPSSPSSRMPPREQAPFNRISGIISPNAGTQPDRASRIIVNYWDVIREMMTRIRKAPPRPARSAGHPGDLRPDYPFEEFRNLHGMDLVRAAHEGALAARREKAGRPAAEIDRQVWENAMLALEYFPLVVRDEADMQSLLKIIESRDEDLALRRFVLSKLAPNQKAPSLLSMFLDDAYGRYTNNFNKVLEAASGHPMENPSFQVESMGVYYDRLMKRYRDTFTADTHVGALAKETGKPVDPAVLLGENPPVLEKATGEKLTGIGYTFAAFATSIAAHIDANSASDPAVKTKTRRILGDIAAKVLLPDRELILHCLDPTRPASPAAGGMPVPPAAPAVPDTEGEAVFPPAAPDDNAGLPVMPDMSRGDQPLPTPVPLPSGL